MTPRNERSFKPEYAHSLLRIAEGDLDSAVNLRRQVLEWAQSVCAKN